MNNAVVPCNTVNLPVLYVFLTRGRGQHYNSPTQNPGSCQKTKWASSKDTATEIGQKHPRKERCGKEDLEETGSYPLFLEN